MRFIQSQFIRSNLFLSLLPALLGLTTIISAGRAKAYGPAQCPPLVFTPFSLVNGITGVPYSQDLNVTGILGGRFSFSIVANGLPPGLNLNPATGAITGTPTTTGTFSFLVRATETNGCSAQRAYTVTVICGSITLAPNTLPAGQIGAPYSLFLNAGGGRVPYTYNIASGDLPVGLSLDSNTGRISGTPSAGSVATWTFDVTATDANPCYVTRTYSLTITCPEIDVSPQTLTALVNTSVNLQLTARGGKPPYNYSLRSGVLPAGLTLSSGGLISGTPTTAFVKAVEINVRDANQCVVVLQMTINITTCPLITVNPPTLPAGRVGVPYNQTFSSSGGAGPYLYGTNAGALPPGLAFHVGGRISDTPTVAGSYPFIVRSTASNGCIGERSYTLVIEPSCPAITLGPASLPVGQSGLPYSQMLTAYGGVAPYAFSLTSGALPNGVGLSNGVLSGNPTTSGNYIFSIRATDANGCFVERSYTLAINTATCPSIIINGPFYTPRVGTAFNMTLSALGGSSPYSYELVSGTLTPGLTFSSTGSVTGTPTTLGTYTFTIRVTDSNGCTGERTLVHNVLPCEGITISPSSLPTGSLGTPYNLALAATGANGPYTFSLGNGSFLPPGLSLSSTGLLSGTPTVGGNYSFTLGATSANGCVEFNLRFLTISDPNCPTISISGSPPATTVGATYNVSMSASGGSAPYSFTIADGSLPSGLILRTSGVIVGTPTTAGTYSFYVRAEDANGCVGYRTYGINISNCPFIDLNPATLPNGTAGMQYSKTFASSGGTSPYSYAIVLGVLPAGLSLSPNGELTGTPTTPGSSSFTVRATDAGGCYGEKAYVFIVDPSTCPTITLNPNALAPGVSGTAYSHSFSAVGGAPPYTYTTLSAALPRGLSLSPGGNLTGTPTDSGSFNFTVRATDANGCGGGRSYLLVINNPTCPTITLSPSSVASGLVGTAYSQTIGASGGAAPYAYSISNGSLPGGLSLTSGGNLTGIPAAAGTFNFTVKATDANGCTGERSYSTVINNPTCPTITVSPNTLPAAVVGGTYNQTFGGAGGSAPYTVNMPSGTLPDGLSLSSSGSLTGTLTKAGSFSFVVRATDGNSCAGDRSYTLTVGPGLVSSVSAANFAPSRPLAPESIVAGFGSNLAENTESALTRPLPTDLAGMKIVIKDSAGVERLAPLYFVSDEQVNYQIPEGTALGRASLSLLSEGELTNASVVQGAGTIDIESVSPGIFSADSTGRGLAAALAFRVKSNGSQSYELVARYDESQQRYVAEPIDLSSASDQVFLVLFGTGFKFRSGLSAVSCTIGGINTEVLYAGEAPGYTGLDQINARLTPALISRGEVDVVVMVEGKPANIVRVAFR